VILGLEEEDVVVVSWNYIMFMNDDKHNFRYLIILNIIHICL